MRRGRVPGAPRTRAHPAEHTLPPPAGARLSAAPRTRRGAGQERRAHAGTCVALAHTRPRSDSARHSGAEVGTSVIHVRLRLDVETRSAVTVCRHRVTCGDVSLFDNRSKFFLGSNGKVEQAME